MKKFKEGDRILPKNPYSYSTGLIDLYVTQTKDIVVPDGQNIQLIKFRSTAIDSAESNWEGSGFYELVGELPYIVKVEHVYTKHYNPDYGDRKICKCGHTYAAHFDSMHNMEACGCKYCECDEFERG